MQELKELQRPGMSIQAISKLTGWDRKTIREYMQAAGLAPEYGPRSVPPRNTGGYTILADWLRSQHSAARVVTVRRFETAPGKQAQVDWGHLGTLELAGHGFTFFNRSPRTQHRQANHTGHTPAHPKSFRKALLESHYLANSRFVLKSARGLE